MSESANSEGTSTEPEKPVPTSTPASPGSNVTFPPFPDPIDVDFDEDIGEEERNYYKSKFPDLNAVKSFKLHCSACDRHLGCSARNENRMRSHPMLRTLVCHTCHTFYNSGEFDKGDDGSELYCRWCGQGGQVYCCADCPHVFCAKCIKRNLGSTKIREIEDADDWKCFKCNPKCLWDLRALCWALLRYCDLKNKITYKTQNPELKEAYQKDCATDDSECCKRRAKRKPELKKREEKKDMDTNKAAVAVISKIPSTIQVKKFASINATADDLKTEKKAVKRPASPKPKPMYMKTPVPVAPAPKLLPNPTAIPSLPKKMRMPNSISPLLRFKAVREPPNNTYARIRPKMTQMAHIPQMPIAIMGNQFNGFNNSKVFHNTNTFNNTYGGNMVINDNINLSLESLTQGLDMAAVAAMANNNSGQDDDVVCTPDFPLEPVCEVTEDNMDDDVQCMTPAPVVPSKSKTPPPPPVPPVTRPLSHNTLPDTTSDNIIQMTENDVTVNAATGGLKFRVDPQTLSSNKMYRLPDGRIFAINANPAMPGGYSATIVAVAETGPGKVAPKGPTYAAKLSAVMPASASTLATKTPRPNTRSNAKRNTPKTSTPKTPRVTKTKGAAPRECDLNVSVEWYRYNLIDAVDALEYSLSRLHKLKKETTSVFLRTRSIQEMKNLHKTLDRLLNTSCTRFNEIRENLSKELKQYLVKKTSDTTNDKVVDEVSEDDDVEILNDDDNDDPIFIDENSVDSNVNETNCNENQEVDLTAASSGEQNDSGDNNIDNFSKMDVDPSYGHESENPNEMDHSEENEYSMRKDNQMDPRNIVERDKTDEKDENDDVNKVTSEAILKSALDKKIETQNKEKEHIECGKEQTEDGEMHEKDNDNEKYEENLDASDRLKGDVANNGVDEESNEGSNEDENKDDDSAENEDKTENEDKSENDDKTENDDKAENDDKGENDSDDENEDKGEKSTAELNHTEKANEELVDEKTLLNEQTDIVKESDDKVQDTEMSEEMIETLLRDDTTSDKVENIVGI